LVLNGIQGYKTPANVFEQWPSLKIIVI